MLIAWLVASAYSALTMYGFYQEDEVGQITAFFLQKAGVLSSDELPWEFHDAVRPWFQPAIYYALFHSMVDQDGYNHLLFERSAYLLSFLLVCGGVVGFAALLFEKGDSNVRIRWLAIAAATCPWFLPSFLLRHSSEALAAVLLILFILAWERSEREPGLRCVLAGGLAALAFWVRFHTGFFLVGWFVSRVTWHDRKGIGRRLFEAGVGFALVCLLMLTLDWWGYGRFELTPLNYFREQVLHGRASTFGTSGPFWYFVQGSLTLLNPLFFVWLALAIRRGWHDRLSRTVSSGAMFFLMAHLLTPHKELRFLIPILPLAILLIARDFLAERPRRWTAHPAYLRVVVGLNVAAFLLFAAMGTKGPRHQIEYALWAIERPATVLSATNLFQHFDREVEPSPFFDDQPKTQRLNARFRKPADLQYVYTPPDRFVEACASEPDAYALITSGQAGDGKPWIDDRSLQPESQFPPAWAAGLLSRTRTWRYKLMLCANVGL